MPGGKHFCICLRQLLLARAGLQESQPKAGRIELRRSHADIALIDVAGSLTHRAPLEQRRAADHSRLRFGEARLRQFELGLSDVDILRTRPVDELAVKRFSRVMLCNTCRELCFDIVACNAHKQVTG